MSNHNSSINQNNHHANCNCNSCTCGFHKCHKIQIPKPKFEGETTHNTFYKQHQIQKKPIIQPPTVIRTKYQQDVLESSYKNQYKNLGINKNTENSLKQLTNNNRLNKISAPFYGETSYNNTYVQKPVVYEVTPKPQYKPNLQKLQGITTYKSAFEINKQEHKNIEKYKNNLTFNQQRKKPTFEGQSSYKETFIDHNVKKQRMPSSNYMFKYQKLQGESHYKQHYPKYEISNYKNGCPVTQLPRFLTKNQSSSQIQQPKIK